MDSYNEYKEYAQRFPFQELTNATLHTILSPIVHQHLGDVGFEVSRPLFWVRSTNAPIRQLFWFRKWKGGVLAPGWGLSLDFVPHIAARKLAWHANVRNAQRDISVDSDELDFQQGFLDIYYVFGPEPVYARASYIVSEALKHANLFWEKSRSEIALFDAVSEARHRPRSFMATQVRLTEAFVCARLGRSSQGWISLQEELDIQERHVIDSYFEPLKAKLLTAFGSAIEVGKGRERQAKSI